MPYKDTEKRREAARGSMRKRREGLTGVNNQGLTRLEPEGLTFQQVVDVFEKHGFKVVRA